MSDFTSQGDFADHRPLRLPADTRVNDAVEALRRAKGAASEGVPDLTSCILSRVAQKRTFVDAKTRQRHRLVRAACLGLAVGIGACVAVVLIDRPWDVRQQGPVARVFASASRDARDSLRQLQAVSRSFTAGTTEVATTAGSTSNTPVLSRVTRRVIVPSLDALGGEGSFSNVVPVFSFLGRTDRITASEVSFGALPTRSAMDQVGQLTARVREAVSPSKPLNATLLPIEQGDDFVLPR